MGRPERSLHPRSSSCRKTGSSQVGRAPITISPPRSRRYSRIRVQTKTSSSITSPTTPDGAVALSVDGDSEQSIRIDLNLVTDHQTKIVIAAALSARTTFGDLGAVALSIDSASIAATATLDAATTERTLLLAEVYRRRDYWRIRAIGQGYDDGPAELAARYGVSEK